MKLSDMQEDKNAIFQMRFPQKLWYLIYLRPDAILWGGTGRTILLNYRILQNYLQCDHSVFKTTNISSFVRQLNLYGFRKVTSHLQDPLCNSSNPYMHEYVHDYFQFGRPELLNKITRKALTMKRNLKSKNPFNNVDQMLYLTPLQKARHTLRMALKKAAQDLYLQVSPKQLCNMHFEYDDSQDDLCEDEDNFEFDWLPSNNENAQSDNPDPAVTAYAPKEDANNNVASYKEEITLDKVEHEESSEVAARQDRLISFTDETSHQNGDSFAPPFLSMPDLDAEPSDSKTGVELLAEFNIDHNIDDGITRKLGHNNDHGSLNCVLPSVSCDQNDDVVMAENHVSMDHYNGEWDQMFNDMINRGPSQECGSELKELYSQISKTIDLLNS